MNKCRKTFPVLLVLTLVLALVAMTISAVQFDREKDKELRALQADRGALTSAVQKISPEEQTALMTGGDAAKIGQPDSDVHALLTSFGPVDEETLPADVVAKLEMEAEIQAKLEAEAEAELPTANRPAVQEDLKVNPFKTQPIMPAYTPRGEILWEGFESGTVPPPNWTAVVTNAYTWEIDSYNPYEGTYNASCYYDADYTGTQDEWLVSPVLDLTGKTDWKLEFAWMGSYYWSVDPEDNYDLEVWISTDGGSNFTTKLWCEEDVGEFTSWVWYEATVDLSGYSTESNVKLGFRYYGYDGAQWSIDAISVNDEAAPIGRCCYDDPTAPLCADVTELECEALGGYSWDQGLNCEDNPCPLAPENDECVNAELIPPPFPATASGTTEGATIDCPGVLDWNAVWYKFDAPYQCNDVSIDYCGGPYEIMTIGVVLYAACDDCDNYILNSSTEWLDCEGLTQPKVYWDNLPGPATYYIPVFLGDGVESPFQLTLDVIECPPPEPGDNCSNPIEVDNPTLRWSDLNQTTCGRGNYYEETCLGSYDGGEDIIYEVIVSSAVTVNITLDPKGTTWTGVAIGTDCPPTDCLDLSTSSSGDPHGMKCVDLDPGVYYIMVDTWPSPDCIEDFDLHITDTTCEALENDDCANATAVGEVVDLAFSTETASNDGGGTCLSSPNIWYCYTATETGDATISLCGSEYDTKMAVYDGCTCDPLGTELACEDDNCGLQSEAVIPVTAGNSYLVEVGGYSTNTGDGILNISVGEPCVVECPPGAFDEGEPCGSDYNGGCNMDVPAFTPIECEDTVCGTAWADGGTRDTDWYQLVLTEVNLVTWGGCAEFPVIFGFVDTSDCNLAAAMDPYALGDPCDTVSSSRVCGPGIYWLFAGNQDYYDNPCNDNNDYWAAVSCQPLTEGACCYEDGSCSPDYEEEACFASGGTSWLGGQDCDPNPCPQPSQPGDNCLDPIKVDIPTLPWSDVGQTTCGRLDDYDNTCLDSYDGGEDIIYEVTVTSPVHVEITLDPKGTTWTGVAIGTDCPPTTCLATSTSSSGDPHGTDCISLDPGVYYIMVDTWPTPDCIPDFDLHITECEPCDIVCVGTPEGEPCINDDEEDDTNGGCNSEPAVWGTIDCDETVCGEWNTYLYGGSDYRDTDWYKFTLTQCSDVTITAVGEFPIVFGFLEQVIDGGGWDCSNFTGSISPYGLGDACDTVVVPRLAMAPGDYAIFVGGQVFSGFGCALGTFEYSLSVDCVPAVPTYCEASGGCDEYIENVTFETINNTTGCDNYGDYTALSATVGVGNSYPITITTANGYSSDTGAVYVDWNQDLDFDDPGEVQFLSPGAGAGPTYSGTVTVPGDALDGETRMRIRLSWNTDPVPCGTQTYGEVEDYTINVSGEPAITYLFEPDPVYVLYKFTIDPMNGYLYLSSDAVGGDVGDMTDVELKVGDCVVPITATEIIDGYGELTGDVLKLTFGIKEYIECEEDGALIYGEIESFFDVYYDMPGSPDQVMNGQVTIIGHTSGDLNLDGSVNVADVTYFVEWLFAGGPAPVILELADVDGSSGNPNVGDLTYLVEYLFNDGPPPMHQ